MDLTKIILSISAAIIFSIIDATFFLVGEEDLQNIFKKNIPFVDNNIASLITGGISASLAILLFSSIKDYINNYYDIYELPIVDAIGIIIGTSIVIASYLLLKKI